MVRSLLLFVSCVIALPSPAADTISPGQVLVATGKSTDPDFAKSVVLVVHSDEHGAIGLLVNRPTRVALAKVFPRLVKSPAGSAAVDFAGPIAVGARAVVRSQAPLRGTQPLFGDVRVTTDSSAIVELAETGRRPETFRVYAGYTGWSAAQLRAEVNAGLWRVIPGEARIVFASRPDLLWSVLNR